MVILDPLYCITRHIKATGNNAEKLQAILDVNKELFAKAMGSQHNHQAWPGGYLRHIADTLRIAQHIYSMEWQVPFSWSSVVLVIFLHDIEKPWMQDRMANDPEMQLWNNTQRRLFKGEIIAKYDIKVTDEEVKALVYIHGEGDDYNNKKRIMNELGALCHAADTLSGRLWHSRNKPNVNIINVTIEKVDNHYGAYAENAYGVTGMGDTIDEVKESINLSIKLIKMYSAPENIPDILKGEYIIKYDTDF